MDEMSHRRQGTTEMSCRAHDSHKLSNAMDRNVLKFIWKWHELESIERDCERTTKTDNVNNGEKRRLLWKHKCSACNTAHLHCGAAKMARKCEKMKWKCGPSRLMCFDFSLVRLCAYISHELRFVGCERESVLRYFVLPMLRIQIWASDIASTHAHWLRLDGRMKTPPHL